MKKSFNVVVEYAMYGTISVEAENLEEAMKFAEDNIDELPFPDESEYIDGSYKIVDKESTILLDEYSNYQEKE